MESKALFNVEAEGYSCEAVEKYITTLKEQYKKVFDYAKATEANNEKLKKICRALKDENDALKSGAVSEEASDETPVEVAAAPAAENEKPEILADVADSTERISVLLSTLTEEVEALQAKIQ